LDVFLQQLLSDEVERMAEDALPVHAPSSVAAFLVVMMVNHPARSRPCKAA
jgi:hypothetical protein